MSVPVQFLRLAQAEYHDAIDWYERQRTGRGAAFAGAVQRALAEIGASPNLFPVVEDDVRAAPVSGYPYVVYFRIQGAAVSVVAVFHGSRNPDEWRRRVGL